MKAVMLSIQPKWCELIASGKKTVEVRKTAPSTRVKCYMYCTKKKFADGRSLYINDPKKRQNYGTYERWFDTSEELVINGGTVFGYKCYRANGRVIGEFVCNLVTPLPESIIKTDCYDLSADTKRIVAESCLTREEVLHYMGDNVLLYGLRISDLKIYDKPKELSEFKRICKEYGSDNPNCDGCKFFIDGRSYEYDESDCAFAGHAPLTRPPQSWCYCEELR